MQAPCRWRHMAGAHTAIRLGTRVVDRVALGGGHSAAHSGMLVSVHLAAGRHTMTSGPFANWKARFPVLLPVGALL